MGASLTKALGRRPGKAEAVRAVSSTASAVARTPAGHALPPQVHATLHVKDLPPGKLVIVGDVHGCYDELQQLLKVAGYDAESDSLLFVGDLVNKGPKSAEVLDFVHSSAHAYAVRGNHDEAAISAHHALARGEHVKKKFAWVGGLSAQQLAYLQSLPFSLLLPELRLLLVHAGLVPGVPLSAQKLQDLFKMRDVVAATDTSSAGAGGGSGAAVRGSSSGPSTGGGGDGLQQEQGHGQRDADMHQVQQQHQQQQGGARPSLLASEERVEGGRPWAGVWDGPHHVFFGHDAKRGLQRCKHATGLDTGCVYGLDLTACVLPPVAQTLAAVRACCGEDGPAPTLDQLGARFVSVPATRVWSEKKPKKAGGDEGVEAQGGGDAAAGGGSADAAAGGGGDDAGAGGDAADGGGGAGTKPANDKKKKKKKKEKQAGGSAELG